MPEAAACQALRRLSTQEVIRRRIWRLLFGERPNYARIEYLERELGFIPGAEPTSMGMEWSMFMGYDLPAMSKVQHDMVSRELLEDPSARRDVERMIMSTFRVPGPQYGRAS